LGGSGFVRFWVEDNGIGIPVQRRHKAFWIFERLHPARQYPGTGMGLALASKAVECMNGRVGVEAAPVKGSRFWFEVPVVSKEDQATGAKAERDGNGGG